MSGLTGERVLGSTDLASPAVMAQTLARVNVLFINGLRGLLLLPLLALLLHAWGLGLRKAPALPAARFRYTDPPPAGFRLEADPATQGTARLVLRLVGPEGTRGAGLGFLLTLGEGRARWTSPPESAGAVRWEPMAGGALGGPGRIQGQVLQVKGCSLDGNPVLLPGRILSLSVSLASGIPPGPVDLVVGPGRPVLLDEHGRPGSLPLAVGQLEAY